MVPGAGMVWFLVQVWCDSWCRYGVVPGAGSFLGSCAGYDFVHGGWYGTVPDAGCGLALVQIMLRYMLESMVWYLVEGMVWYLVEGMVWYLVEGMVWYLVKGMFGTC